MSHFAIVDESDLDSWTQLQLPTLDTTDFDLSGTYHFMTVGLFQYDPQIYLYTYFRSLYNTYFASGKYDGWAVGSEIYFHYYPFEEHQSFGACIDTHCWGAWLYYDSKTGYYEASPITFPFAKVDQT